MTDDDNRIVRGIVWGVFFSAGLWALIILVLMQAVGK